MSGEALGSSPNALSVLPPDLLLQSQQTLTLGNGGVNADDLNPAERESLELLQTNAEGAADRLAELDVAGRTRVLAMLGGSSVPETFGSPSSSSELASNSEAPDACSSTARSRATTKASRRANRMRSPLMVLLLGVVFVAVGAAIGWWVRDSQDSDLAPLAVDATIDRPMVLEGPSNAATGQIPGVLGLTLDEAQRVLFDAGVPAGVITVTERPTALEEGQVILQEPSAGSVFRGSVMLVVSTEALVPELVGLSLEEARGLLEDLGSRPTIQHVSDSRVESGIVVGVIPPAGALLERSIQLRVSSS